MEALERAMAILGAHGIDDYPGGESNPDGTACIAFDTKEEAIDARKILKNYNFKVTRSDAVLTVQNSGSASKN